MAVTCLSCVLHVDASCKQVRMCLFCLQENVEWHSEKAVEAEDVCEVEQC